MVIFKKLNDIYEIILKLFLFLLQLISKCYEDKLFIENDSNYEYNFVKNRNQDFEKIQFSERTLESLENALLSLDFNKVIKKNNHFFLFFINNVINLRTFR